jgi:phosphoribosylanthranilate isomerase
MALVKVCGLAGSEPALAAADAGATRHFAPRAIYVLHADASLAGAGAHFIGLIFAPASKRRVDLATAAEVVSQLRSRGAPVPPAPAFDAPRSSEARVWFRVCGDTLSEWARGRAKARRPLAVGVFLDQPIDEVNAIAEAAQLDMVQLHGRETPDECRRANRPVIKVLHVTAATTAQQLLEQARAYTGVAVALLLDTSRGAASGGTGQTFDWSVAAAVTAEMPAGVAGGLTAANVGAAIEATRPLLVDTASGVEVDGKSPAKDLDKIAAFVRNGAAKL